MSSSFKRITVGLAALCSVSLTQFSSAQHAGDIFVGRSAANQMKYGPNGFVPDEPTNVVLLPPTSGLFNGWSDSNPGFDRVVTAVPELDLYTMASGANIYLEIVTIEPAFQIYDTSLNLFDQPGQRPRLGNNALHRHLTWFINSQHPQFDPNKRVWTCTFKFVDLGSTGYSASAPFVMRFANACNPSDFNADGRVDGADVQAFVRTLFNPAAASPWLLCAADTDQNSIIDANDIPGFVNRLLGL